MDKCDCQNLIPLWASFLIFFRATSVVLQHSSDRIIITWIELDLISIIIVGEKSSNISQIDYLDFNSN